MTIDSTTVDALEALAHTIWDPHITPAPPGSALGDTWGTATGISAHDPAIDQQIYDLVAPIALAIDGVAIPKDPFTLNQTFATHFRPHHWWLSTEEVDNPNYPWTFSASMEYHPSRGAVAGGVFSWGAQMGFAIAATMLHGWAHIVKMWLSGGYPLAVTQPATPTGTPITSAPPL